MNDSLGNLNILVTNDDGWDAVGVRILAQSAARFGTVTIVAPANPQSGISHRLTFDRPLQLVEQNKNAYSVDGTPADCVRIALTQLKTKFDIVLSGVNDGANLGADVYVSGTIAAAREARLFGYRAIALSQYRKRYHEPFDWEFTRELTDRVLVNVFSTNGENPELVNINFPDSDRSAADIEIVECGLDPHPLPSEYRQTEQGFVYASRYSERMRDDGKDVAVCFSGSIATTRLG